MVGGFSISLNRFFRRAPVEVFALDTARNTYSWDWEEVSICVPPGNISILLTATQGDKNTSDLAIDDVHLTDAQCNNYINISGILSFLLNNYTKIFTKQINKSILKNVLHVVNIILVTVF